MKSRSPSTRHGALRRTKQLCLLWVVVATMSGVIGCACTRSAEQTGGGGGLKQGLISLTAEADAYVRSGSYASSNFGTSSSVQIDLDDSGTQKQGFMRFAVGNVGPIQSAKLRLYITNASNDSADVYALAGASW